MAAITVPRLAAVVREEQLVEIGVASVQVRRPLGAAPPPSTGATAPVSCERERVALAPHVLHRLEGTERLGVGGAVEPQVHHRGALSRRWSTESVITRLAVPDDRHAISHPLHLGEGVRRRAGPVRPVGRRLTDEVVEL